MTLKERYSLLLIKQYYTLPKARAEVDAMSRPLVEYIDAVNQYYEAFDLDIATGHRLDLIGKIVGVSRSVPDFVPKVFFGFEDDPDATGFADLLNPLIMAQPFFDFNQSAFTDLQLNDNDYRTIIRVKAAKNVSEGTIIDDDFRSIQDVLRLAFDNLSEIVDRRDMSFDFYVAENVREDIIKIIVRLDLVPRPNGVELNIVGIYNPVEYFGFEYDDNALGFADLANGDYTPYAYFGFADDNAATEFADADDINSGARFASANDADGDLAKGIFWPTDAGNFANLYNAGQGGFFVQLISA